MNPFEDPRAREAELAAFEAGRAERQGGNEGAGALWARAGALYGELAAEAVGLPRHRAILAVSHVVCLGRGGELEDAVGAALHWAADPELPAESRRELEELAIRYARDGTKVPSP